jgi:hypothetical protein
MHIEAEVRGDALPENDEIRDGAALSEIRELDNETLETRG